MYKITEKKILNDFVVQMLIEAPLVANKAKPGQFIILRVDDNGERIPLTVAGVNKENGTVKIIFQIVGGTTEKLAHKEQGEYIADFVGPLGVPTHLDGIKKVDARIFCDLTRALCGKQRARDQERDRHTKVAHVAAEIHDQRGHGQNCL